ASRPEDFLGQPNRAANRAGELIVAQVIRWAWGRPGAEGTRVGYRVAGIPERHAIIAVGPGLGSDIDDAASGRAVFSRIRRTLYGASLPRLRREAHDCARDADAGVVDAVRQHHRAAGPPAIDTQVESGYRLIGGDSGILAAGVP